MTEGSEQHNGGPSITARRVAAYRQGLGEPARSTLEADAAAELLARTGWQVTASDGADEPEAASRRERLRAAGLLTASAGLTARLLPPAAAPVPGPRALPG